MKAVILAGGEGTRLRPLTQDLPKPLVPLVNRPFVRHQIDWLKRHGVTDVILSVHHQAERFHHLLGDEAHLLQEDRPLGTAGAARLAYEQLKDETFVVLNGDILTDLDLTAMRAFHREKGAHATLALARVADPTAYGLVMTAPDDRVTAFIEKPSAAEAIGNTINAGIYLMEPSVLANIPPDTPTSFERHVFPLLAARDPLFGYASSLYWRDIGTLQQYLLAHRDALNGRISLSLPGQEKPDRIFVGEQTYIDPTAKLIGPLLIGDNVTIGPYAWVEGPCTLMDGVSVGASSQICHSVVWPQTQIGGNCQVTDAIIGRGCRFEDGCTISEGAVLGHGSKLGPGSRFPL